MLDYSLIGTGISISRDELRPPKGYSIGVLRVSLLPPEHGLIFRTLSTTRNIQSS